MGWSLFNLSWFLRYHMFHMMTTNKSTLLPAFETERNRYFISANKRDWWQAKSGTASQIGDSFEHSQIACRTDSSAYPHCSHLSSFRIFLFFKFFFTGITSLLDLHTKFLILFGTSRPHISFHRSLFWSELVGGWLWSSSLAKNLYLDLTVY